VRCKDRGVYRVAVKGLNISHLNHPRHVLCMDSGRSGDPNRCPHAPCKCLQLHTGRNLSASYGCPVVLLPCYDPTIIGATGFRIGSSVMVGRVRGDVHRIRLAVGHMAQSDAAPAGGQSNSFSLSIISPAPQTQYKSPTSGGILLTEAAIRIL
jgi:hypothetical protein